MPAPDFSAAMDSPRTPDSEHRTRFLEEQRRVYEIVLSVSDDFAYLFDCQGRFTFANRRLLEVWGRTLEEIVGKTCLDLGYPEWHAAMHMREIEQVIATKSPIKGEVPYTAPTGIFGVYEYIFKPVIGPDGQVEAIAGTTRDVTDRKRAEEIMERQYQVLQLLAEERPLEEILTALLNLLEQESGGEMHGAILLLDDAGLLHHAAAPTLPASYTDAISGFSIGPSIGSCGRSAWLGERVHVEDIASDVLWADFRDLALAHGLRACSSCPIMGTDGKVLGIFSMYYTQPRAYQESDSRIIDTATRTASVAIERKRAEEALRRSRDDSEAANRAKDRFLAALSHELRTPLTPVLMAIAAHQLDPATPPSHQQDLAMMKRNLELETTLIDDLLDLTRVMSGKLRLRLERLDINVLVSEACKICTPEIDAKSIRLETRLASGLLPIQADAARFHQVLWNVLINAAKFTGEKGTILVSTNASGANAEIRIQDSGSGIETEFLTKIFDAFEQGSSSHGGIGMGLAICKALMELHGGSIHAESGGPGQGSTFVIAIPLVESLPIAPRAAAPVSTKESIGARLLIVEDHADTAEILCRLLEASGYKVRHAGTVAEASLLAESENFDLLLSDLGLPDGTGYDLMASLRGRGILGIAMSGYGMDDDIQRGRDAGFSEHMVKPVELATLKTTIERLLQKRA